MGILKTIFYRGTVSPTRRTVNGADCHSRPAVSPQNPAVRIVMSPFEFMQRLAALALFRAA
jgi:hypothetical protein